jgi:hypothetical protein
LAWDDYRTKRDPDRQVTSEISGVAAGAGAPDAQSARPARDWHGWGQRFGWMIAVGLSVLALVLSGIAVANSGDGQGRGGFGRGFDRVGAPSVWQPHFPQGQDGAPGDGQGFGQP